MDNGSDLPTVSPSYRLTVLPSYRPTFSPSSPPSFFSSDLPGFSDSVFGLAARVPPLSRCGVFRVVEIEAGPLDRDLLETFCSRG